jgi:peptide/nickel transport system ATP-binding protein
MGSNLVSDLATNLPNNFDNTPGSSFQDDLSGVTLLRVIGLSKKYVRGGVWTGRVQVAAVTSADFEISRGQTLALVGESGSGKSTVARCVARIERPDTGQILLRGTDIARLSLRALRPFRSGIQMVFQDAVTSMSPRFSALEAIEEPLRIQRKTIGSRQARRDRVGRMMIEVGLSPDWMDRPISNFSGGQGQRLALARALALRPLLLVLDEALTGLDVSTQAQIANLLLDLQAAHQLTYLLISHDLALVARLANMVGVMAGGRIVEAGPAQQIVFNPTHAATKKLLASAKTTATNFTAITGVRS